MVEFDDERLGELKEILVDAAAPRQIILFGSRARGDARPDSDLDLVVVEDELFGPGRSRRRLLDCRGCSPIFRFLKTF